MKKVEIMTTVTINYNTVELEVRGKYEPFEQGYMYDTDGLGQPDYPATFEVIKVLADGFDITQIFYDEQLNEIIELALNQLK
jgi:hypothetical protein